MSDKRNLYYFDFDKLFNDFAEAYYNEHADEYENPDEFMLHIPELHEIWENSPQPALDGMSPKKLFDSIPASELTGLLVGACEGDGEPSSLLFERIAGESSIAGELCALASKTTDEKLLAVTLSLISEMHGGDDDFFIGILKRTDICDDIKDQAADELCDRVTGNSALRDKLIALAEKTENITLAELCLEPLTYTAPGNDRVLALLKRLLDTDANLPYVAGLMARYGDDRAAAYLYPLLDDCDYASFLEIRNAIERLGGTVDDGFRDFTNDPMYSAIKGIK